MHLRRTARLALLAAATPLTLLATTGTATAASAAGVGTGDSVAPGGGSVTGACAYTATLPQTGDFNTLRVSFTGTALATAPVGAVPVSTTIRCSLRNGGSGGAGISLPGATAAIAGIGTVARLAVSPEICTTVAAAFSNGTTAPERTNCTPL